MSERTPKQPLNDPEYTVPEYSVLLPSDEAKNSTAEDDAASHNVASGNAASTNAAPSGAVDNNAAEDNASGDSTPEQATTDYREATAGYTAPVASEQVIPKRPQAMRSVMWCATAMIALRVLSSSLSILLPDQSYIDFEMVMSVLFSMLAFTLLASIIPIFVLWKIWEGREWARVITIIYSAFAVIYGVGSFLVDLAGSSSRIDAVYNLLSIVSGVFTVVLHLLMITLLTRAPIRTYTQIVSGARALEHQQMMSETRQAAGQVPAELRELFDDDEDGERTSSGGNTPRPPHRSAGWGT